MNSGKNNRREFLKQIATTATGFGALSLTGCSSLDRLFGPDPGLYENEILIVGAGLAGLVAAFELKKKKIPFRMIEASSRPGGRVQSLEFFRGEKQVAELGGEFIDSRHQRIQSLCSELGLELENVPDNPGEKVPLFARNGQLLSDRRWNKELTELTTQLGKRLNEFDLTGDRGLFRVGAGGAEAELDRVSLAEHLDSFRRASTTRAVDFMLEAARVQFGVEPNKLSAAVLYASMASTGRAGAPRRIKGGSERLVRGLFERVRGVLPEFAVRFGTTLVSIRTRKDRFECRLQTPQGTQTIWARCLIVAIPPTALRQVAGLRDLELGVARQEAIEGLKMATHSKLILGFSERFWTQRSQGPILTRNLLGLSGVQSVSDATRGSRESGGLLSFTLGGEAGRKATMALKTQALEELKRFWPRASHSFEDKVAFRNWSAHPLSRGSIASFGPGEMTRWNGVFEEGDYDNRLIFAGEHGSARFHGTMEGAIESGQRAAQLASAALERVLMKSALPG